MRCTRLILVGVMAILTHISLAQSENEITELDPVDKIDFIISKTDDPLLKAELFYKKAYLYYKSGQYRNAYNTGRACTGEFKSKGLLIAAQSVAALATSCGESTFERKCNYIYAAQLAEEAGRDEIAGKYRSSGPSVSACTKEDHSQPIYLPCWGITVNACQ